MRWHYVGLKRFLSPDERIFYNYTIQTDDPNGLYYVSFRIYDRQGFPIAQIITRFSVGDYGQDDELGWFRVDSAFYQHETRQLELRGSFYPESRRIETWIY